MTGVEVCIPWRPTADRLPAFNRCITFWRDNGFSIHLGDSDGVTFSKSQALNRAVKKTDADIVILADADTLPDNINQVTDAIHCIDAADAHMVFPFTWYHYVDADHVETEDLSTITDYSTVEHSTGGIVVIRRSTYWAAGGFDERFVGWGHEDCSFAYAVTTMFGEQRLPGIVWSFEHPSVIRSPSDGNVELGGRYRDAKWNTVEMQALIDEASS